jgi:hypothetical protein
MAKTKSLYELLRNKQIIAILDGDLNFGEISFEEDYIPIRNAMPYLSGPVLCGISNNFGLAVSYGGDEGTKSRWVYLDELMQYCINNNRMSDLLSYLFSKVQFTEQLKGHSPAVIELAYKKIVETVIGQINGILYFGGNELFIAGQQFLMR